MAATTRVSLPDPPLQDGDVALRGWRPRDVAALVEACQDPEIPLWTEMPFPYLEGHARDWIGRQPDLQRTGEGVHFAIVATQTGRLLGGIGLKLDAGEGMAELGYWLAAQARGRGVATRAARLVADWGLDALGLTTITVHIDERNIASRRVAERAGFTYAGALPGGLRGDAQRAAVAYCRSSGRG